MWNNDELIDKKDRSSPNQFKLKKNEQELFWSIDETARYLGYTPRWLRELAKKGMFYPCKVGKKWLFKKSMVDKYISENNKK